jgi:PIN domain nuclease of toxin-antitoxin system
VVRVLLGTHALIWIVTGEKIERRARAAIEAAAKANGVLVSPVSGWEIGLLATRTGASRLMFTMAPDEWMRQAMSLPGIAVLPLEPVVAAQASLLPEPFHTAPADRLLVAQARAADVSLITRDRRMLDYADSGHMRAITC